MKKNVTYKDIMAKEPCYDPQEIGMPVNYNKPVKVFIDEYKDRVKEKHDILWLLLDNDYMSARDLRLFAVCCTMEILKLFKNHCDVVERYAQIKGFLTPGKLTDDELYSAWADARYAAARAAARDAVMAAAWDAERAAQIEQLKTYF